MNSQVANAASFQMSGKKMKEQESRREGKEERMS